MRIKGIAASAIEGFVKSPFLLIYPSQKRETVAIIGKTPKVNVADPADINELVAKAPFNVIVDWATCTGCCNVGVMV